MMSEADPFAQSNDPLIEEVRAIRRSIFERFDNDIDKLIDHLQERQREYSDRLVSRGPSVTMPKRRTR